MFFALAFFTLFGHAFLWIGLANRLNGMAMPRWLIKSLTKSFFAILLAGLFAISYRWSFDYDKSFVKIAFLSENIGDFLFAYYIALCWLAGATTIAVWLWRRFYFRRSPKILRSCRRDRAAISLEETSSWAEEKKCHFCLKLPGNQSLRLEVTRLAFDVPRLPAALDGMTILHVSDFHFSGRVGKAYFREVVRVCNELQPDLIALTGDYIDDNACIDWIPDTLGRLAARHGVYYILGNHDAFLDARRLRETMNSCGLIDLGGEWMQVPFRGESILLAGNELPWIAPAAELSLSRPTSAQGGPVRIVLAHTPDQIEWSRHYEVDLMLSGHTHGGQIRLPLIGAVLMPSSYGVKYDCGFFHLPPTILHVTRGISGKHPLRWCCAPEIALLTLHCPRS